MNMDEALTAELADIRARGLGRTMRLVADRPARSVFVDGKTLTDFSSNDYLGLARDPRVIRSAAAALERWGAGGGSSRLIAGTTIVHRSLEEALARLKAADDALVFPSGFQANAAIIGTLLGPGDCLVMDRLCHASLWDAARTSRVRVFVYPHRDLAGLEKALERAGGYRRIIVATESVFSMDGDCAPLGDIARLARSRGAWTMVDEAHATGVFGPRGAGLAEEQDAESLIDIKMGTLSKALGSQGGFVCGSRALIEYLTTAARPFIYTTALAPAACGAALAALDIVSAEPARRSTVRALAASLRSEFAQRGWDCAGSQSQIVPLVIGTADDAMRVARGLFERGIYAPAIRPPTVPENACRLRFSLSAQHQESDLHLLLSALDKVMRP